MPVDDGFGIEIVGQIDPEPLSGVEHHARPVRTIEKARHAGGTATDAKRAVRRAQGQDIARRAGCRGISAESEARPVAAAVPAMKRRRVMRCILGSSHWVLRTLFNLCRRIFYVPRWCDARTSGATPVGKRLVGARPVQHMSQTGSPCDNVWRRR